MFKCIIVHNVPPNVIEKQHQQTAKYDANHTIYGTYNNLHLNSSIVLLTFTILRVLFRTLMLLLAGNIDLPN